MSEFWMRRPHLHSLGVPLSELLLIRVYQHSKLLSPSMRLWEWRLGPLV